MGLSSEMSIEAPIHFHAPESLIKEIDYCGKKTNGCLRGGDGEESPNPQNSRCGTRNARALNTEQIRDVFRMSSERLGNIYITSFSSCNLVPQIRCR